METSVESTSRIDARAEQFLTLENSLTGRSEKQDSGVHQVEIMWVEEIPFSDLPEQEAELIHADLQRENQEIVVCEPYSETMQILVAKGDAIPIENLVSETYLSLGVEDEYGAESTVYLPLPSSDQYDGSELDQLLSLFDAGPYELTALNSRSVWLLNTGCTKHILTDEHANRHVWAARHGYGQFHSGTFEPASRLSNAEETLEFSLILCGYGSFIFGFVNIFGYFPLVIPFIILTFLICAVMSATGFANSDDTQKRTGSTIHILQTLHKQYPRAYTLFERFLNIFE